MTDGFAYLRDLEILGRSDAPGEWCRELGLQEVRLLSDTEFIPRQGLPQAATVELPRWLSVCLLHDAPRTVARALRLLLRARPGTAILCLGSHQLGLVVCILNRRLPIRRRRILLWGAFIETESPLKRRMIRQAVEGASVSLVWSRRQIELQAAYLGVPRSKFVPMLYKANHSMHPPDGRRLGGYVFAGGNSQRDYRTLFEAVRDTDVQLIVSTTRADTVRGLEVPSNVVVLQAREPAFMRLMAGSRFVVYTITPGGVRGAAEASIANAMWHGRAVICADDVSASDYVVDGETGYVVPAGDVAAVRERVLECWNDPARAEEMGRRGHARAERLLTHETFIQKLLVMGAVLAGADRSD